MRLLEGLRLRVEVEGFVVHSIYDKSLVLLRSDRVYLYPKCDRVWSADGCDRVYLAQNAIAFLYRRGTRVYLAQSAIAFAMLVDAIR